MDWTNFGTFLVLSRARSLRDAARELRVSASTVARRLESLEAELGFALAVRAAGGVVLTEAGRTLAASGREVEDRMTHIRRSVSAARDDDVEGLVRVSATETVTAELLAPSLATLLNVYPRLRVTIRVEAGLASFSRPDTDVAVRMVKPAEPRLISRRLGAFESALYSTRAYLASLGDAPLSEARFLAYDDGYGRIPEVRWFESHGLAEAIVLRTTSTRALVEATRAGCGLGLLPTFLAQRHAELNAVVSPWPLPVPREMYCVTHEDLRKRPAVRIVMRHIDAAFAALGLGSKRRAVTA